MLLHLVVFSELHKSIRDLDLELRSLNVLIGANGAGKSNFISVFALLNAIVEERLQAYTGPIGAENLLYYGRRYTPAMEIELSFRTEQNNLFNGYDIRLIPTNQGSFIIESESASFHDRDQYEEPYVVRLGHGEETHLHDAEMEERVVRYVKQSLAGLKIYHFHDTSTVSAMKATQDLHDNRRLATNASNLAAYLYLLHERHADSYRKIVQTIRRVAPFFDDFVLNPLELNPERIRLEWRDRNSDKVFDAHSLSDGTLRFICLATLLLQPTEKFPPMILIDEPELGLHPHALRILAGLILSATSTTQVIMATQSVPLVNQFRPEHVIIVNQADGQSSFRFPNEADLQNWMQEFSEYGMGDLWEKNILGGYPRPEQS